MQSHKLQFAAILPETDAEQAGMVAERIRAAVAAFPLASALVEGGIPVTVSVGLAAAMLYRYRSRVSRQ